MKNKDGLILCDFCGEILQSEDILNLSKNDFQIVHKHRRKCDEIINKRRQNLNRYFYLKPTKQLEDLLTEIIKKIPKK